MRRIVAVIALLMLSLNLAHANDGTVWQADAKASALKALPLLRKGMDGHVAKKTCFACHNQLVPMLALTSKGESKTDDLAKQAKFIADFLDRNRDNYKEGKGQGGQVDTAGQALFTLELAGWKADSTTEAVIEYLLQRDEKLGHWRPVSNRPPSEASAFTTNFYAIRALQKWGTEAQKVRIDKRLASARTWLLKTPAKDTEDRVYRLLSLQAIGESLEVRKPTVDALLRSQRKDGGWGQTDAMGSDAYATGSALYALYQSGQVAVSSLAYRRGIAFLVMMQEDDGSWKVRSRSKPFQTYYESGFPHGNDQFISIAASGWATTALMLALPAPRIAE